MQEIGAFEAKNTLGALLDRVERGEEIIITRHGKPAGLLIGFQSEEDWFDYRLEHDPRFLERVEAARQSLRKGRGIRLDDIEK